MALSDTAAPIPSRTEDSPIKVSGWLAVVGAVAGFGALAASSCCELPLALAGSGLAVRCSADLRSWPAGGRCYSARRW
jgi:hypothetical protein